MKATVISPFWDKNKQGVYYNVGDVVDFDKARIDDLITRGLVEVNEETQSKKEKTKKQNEEA
ncbi:MAG: hypothetical protein LBI45_08835 [Bacteroidales bacterium]|jgi:hypothetical protein|nr:hypothetical protein [Bacteroidales bacterium]